MKNARKLFKIMGVFLTEAHSKFSLSESKGVKNPKKLFGLFHSYGSNTGSFIISSCRYFAFGSSLSTILKLSVVFFFCAKC